MPQAYQIRIALLVLSLLAVTPLSAGHTAAAVEGRAEISVPETSSLTSALRDSLVSLVEFVQSFTTNLFGGEPRDDLEKLTDRIIDALQTFASKLIDASEQLAQEIFDGVVVQMVQVKNEFIELADRLDDQFDWAVQNLNESLINNTESIDLWAATLKNELRTFNDTYLYKQGCRAVDEFIHESTEQLQRCCNITFKSVISLCRSIRTTLAGALRVLADVLDRMQICLEDKNSYLEFMVPCINLTYDEVSALITEAVQLRHRIGTIMPVKIMYSNCCISIALIMEQRQHELSAKLLSLSSRRRV